MTQSTWIETRSGRRFDVANPREEDVDIEDIALALAQTCRFGGHALRWISVAWHCVVVHDIMATMRDDREARLAALLHDAAETYVGDMPRPLKLAFPDFVAAETRVQDVIHRKFGLQPSSELLALIRKVDNQTLLEEARAYMATGGRGWELLDEGLKIPGAACVPPCPRDIHEAGRAFLERFHSAYERRH
jgi:5'-deoxynucleotidase YfbR-like HD superfamily hydrolase